MKKCYIFIIASTLSILFSGCGMPGETKIEPKENIGVRNAETPLSDSSNTADSITTTVADVLSIVSEEAAEDPDPEYEAYYKIVKKLQKKHGKAYIDNYNGIYTACGLSIVRLLDFNGDGIMELIVGWQDEAEPWNDPPQNVIYTYEEGKAKKIFQRQRDLDPQSPWGGNITFFTIDGMWHYRDAPSQNNYMVDAEFMQYIDGKMVTVHSVEGSSYTHSQYPHYIDGNVVENEEFERIYHKEWQTDNYVIKGWGTKEDIEQTLDETATVIKFLKNGGTGGALSLSVNNNDNSAVTDSTVPESTTTQMTVTTKIPVLTTTDTTSPDSTDESERTNTNTDAPDTPQENNFFDIRNYEGTYKQEPESEEDGGIWVKITSASDNYAEVEITVCSPRATRISETHFSGDVSTNPFTFESDDGWGHNSYTIEFLSDSILLSCKCLKHNKNANWALPTLNGVELTK